MNTFALSNSQFRPLFHPTPKRTAMKASRLLALTSCVALLLALFTQTVSAAQYVINEVMSGLVSPRGLALGPDGALYVAEAGSGGSGPSIVAGTGNTVFYGTTGGVSRLLNGVQTRVLNGVGSLATAAGQDAAGVDDIVFDGTGQAFGTIGLGANPRCERTLARRVPLWNPRPAAAGWCWSDRTSCRHRRP